MNRSRFAVLVYCRAEALKLLIGEEPLALASLVHSDRGAWVRALWLDAPLFGLVHQGSQNLA